MTAPIWASSVARHPLDAEGKPIPELFVQDQLHFTDAGYRVFTKLVTPILPSP